jgi:hypothetical protein
MQYGPLVLPQEKVVAALPAAKLFWDEFNGVNQNEGGGALPGRCGLTISEAVKENEQLHVNLGLTWTFIAQNDACWDWLLLKMC